MLKIRVSEAEGCTFDCRNKTLPDNQGVKDCQQAIKRNNYDFS
jgi:hypothetical protein